MNRAIKTVLKYERKTFMRNRYQLVMLMVTFLFGLYAIYYGQAEIDAQRDTMAAITVLENNEFSAYKASFNTELETLKQEQTHDIASRPSFAWFRHGYHAILPAHDYAALSIGQRDLFRFYYRLTGMSLYYQLFENELANPVNLMAGNFDLSFVLIYLFPLLVIIFCYSLFSSERENGTLPLLLVQSASIRKVILVRLAFYFVLITGLALFITLIGLFTSGNPFAAENRFPAMVWLLSVFVYCTFWFCLLFLIISFRRSSAFNAMTSAGCWLLFLIVVPALLNVAVTTKYPLSSTALAGLTRRTGLENEEDKDESREVIMEFLAHQPDLAGSDSLMNNDLMAKAYAAFTSLKDAESEEEVKRYNSQVEKRNQWTKGFYWLSPAVNLQHTLTDVCETDLETFLHFQDDLTRFHGEITGFYFKRLFWDKPITLQDYSRLPSFETLQRESGQYSCWLRLGKTTLLAVLIFSIGFFNMNKKPYQN